MARRCHGGTSSLRCRTCVELRQCEDCFSESRKSTASFQLHASSGESQPESMGDLAENPLLSLLGACVILDFCLFLPSD